MSLQFDYSFLTDKNRGDHALTPEEDDAIAYAFGGQAGLDELRKTRATYEDGSWQANSVMGFGSEHCTDIRAHNVDDKFRVVLWGGPGAASSRIWSYHIAKARPTADSSFDSTLDVPVDLAKERVRVLFPMGGDNFVELRHGALIAEEGSTIILEHEQKKTPITFPLRTPVAPLWPGAVMLT